MADIKDLRVLIDRIPYAEGNLGEEAILASLLQDLRRIGVNKIAVLSNMPERTQQRHGSDIKVIADHKGMWWRLPEIVKAHDILVWGGGHMLQDRSSQLYIPYVTKNLMLARYFKKPRFIYAPGLGPVEADFGKWLSRLAIDGSDTIVVRDVESEQLLRDCRVRSDIQVTADPVFSLTTEADDISTARERKAPVIGIAPRRHFYRKGNVLPVSMQFASGKQENPQFEFFLQEIAGALDQLILQDGAEVQFLPMDLGPNPRDDLICQRIRQFMVYGEKTVLYDDDAPLMEFIGRLGKLDVLISARLHGIIMGMRFGLPFIGIDSDGKIPRLAGKFGVGDFVVIDAELRKEGLYDMARRAVNENHELRTRLAAQNKEISNQSRQNYDFLEGCLNNLAVT
ncbi:polysaccharide pyruvyl transferase family protein [bacterium]|nr:polysaccharide pyruvyl transferase family protein [bacterium]